MNGIHHAASGPETKSRTTVFFDGACPLCVREIAFYRRRKGAERIGWHDMSADESGTLPDGLTHALALKRLHLMTARGDLLSGAQAFARPLLPAFRIPGLVFRYWPLDWILEALYRIFLVLRPLLQELARRILREPMVCDGSCDPRKTRS